MRLRCLAAIVSAVAAAGVPSPSHAAGGTPGVSQAGWEHRTRYEALAAGPRQVRLLPGCRDFTFTMYGCPGDADRLESLVAAMRARGLGNGFDPGPPARAESAALFERLATAGWPVICYPGRADMQVKDGRARMSDADESAVRILDRAGVFSAVQLGEWGYYFHNLSWVESWWRDVYGDDFERMKRLMKPAGLRGYDARPASRRECYDALADYFAARHRAMRGRTISVTGHSHYEAYAAEWGAVVIGLELGENIAFTQSKIAFARGAARAWRRPWSVQVSPWFAGSCTTSGPLRREGSHARGLDAGHSLSFYERMWLHAWFAGAAMVTPENGIAIFFEKPEPPWTPTAHGDRAARVFAFMRAHDRGIPWTPLAIVLDHLAGYNAYQGRPWGILDPTAGDLETRDLLEEQLFPGSDHIHAPPDPVNPEASYLRPTPYGELCDVFLSNVEGAVLDAYPAILLAGDIAFDARFLACLRHVLSRGRALLLHPRHAQALGKELDSLGRAGRVEILEAWTNPKTGRSAAIAEERLARLCAEHLPVSVEGDIVQYAVNRTPRSWVVELVNNRGVVKTPDAPAVIDAAAAAAVELKPRFPFRHAVGWFPDGDRPVAAPLRVIVPPGGTVCIELFPRD